jgi:hypothetical protein
LVKCDELLPAFAADGTLYIAEGACLSPGGRIAQITSDGSLQTVLDGLGAPVGVT